MNPNFDKLVQSQMDRRRLQSQRAITIYNEAKRVDHNRPEWRIHDEIASELGCSRKTAYQLVQFAKRGGVSLPITKLKHGIEIDGEKYHTLDEAAKIIGVSNGSVIRKWIDIGRDGPKYEIITVNGKPTVLIRDSDLRQWLAETAHQITADGFKKFFDNYGRRFLRKPEDAIDIDAIHVKTDEQGEELRAAADSSEPSRNATRSSKPHREYGSCQVSKAAVLKEMRDLLRTRKRLSQREYLKVSKYARRYEAFFRGTNAYHDFVWAAARGLALRQNGNGSSAHRVETTAQQQEILETVYTAPQLDEQAGREGKRRWWQFWRRA